jgi:uncharacterized protein (UPF0548 family)
MPTRPSLIRRWRTAATWPFGIAMTTWDYMWRTTPMHRRQTEVAADEAHSELLEFPSGVSAEEVTPQERGYGPLFHRRYRTRIRDTQLSPEALVDRIKENLNGPAPTTFARFQKLVGDRHSLAIGDEYVVRMPGPWDGPVRVIDSQPRSFRLATLEGHLEAGQIEFRARADADHELAFEIESWARSGDALSNVLYHHLRMAKEVQAHMWISFLEGVVALAGGRMTGGVEIDTRRVEDTPDGDEDLLGPPSIRRRLEALQHTSLNFDPSQLEAVEPGRGWQVTDICQALPAEPAGMPVRDGSWEIARRLMRGYEFADPSIVRAYYDPSAPLEGRNMLLKLQAFGLVHLFVGVRVGSVYEHTRELDGQSAHIWGWNYRTLDGHLEMGQMAWEVWKWLDTGKIEFRVHATSRDAPIGNPLLWLGYRLVRTHEREMFLQSTRRRMRTFVELALEREPGGQSIREAAAELTARRSAQGDPVHGRLAFNSEPYAGP